jgi:GT2 family glycosyltransferase
MQKIEVSIIIVAYRAREDLFNCLHSIYKNLSGKVTFEVIIVDNNETNLVKKELVQKFPEVIYLKSKTNLGFGGGLNAGEGRAKGTYLFCLNQDIQVQKGAAEKLVQYFDNPKVAVVGPTLSNKTGKEYDKTGSGRLDPLSAIFSLSFINRLFPNNPVSKKYFLSGVDRRKPIEVDVVPGCAFLVRHDVYREVGGFDEKFFLYFEESDFCKRVKEAGYDIWILPDAKVIHGWGKSTTKGEKINKIFVQSRMYYFRKHYGFLSMLLVEVFCRFSKHIALLLVITLLGAVLRFWNFSDHMTFHGELGHNYLAARDYFELKQIPLIGPPTSHPWLSFSPLFYWIIIPVLFVSNWNPVGPALFMTVISCLLPVLAYFSFHKMLNQKGRLVVAFLFAIFPFMITLSREARFFSLSVIPIFPFIYFTYRKKYLLAAFLLSLSLSFHYTPLTLLPAFLYLFIKSKPTKSDTFFLLGAFVVPHIPYLVHLIFEEPTTIIKILEWIPYRFARFGGIIQKDVSVDPGTNILQFLSLLFTPISSVIIGLVSVALVVFSKKQYFLLLFLFTGCLGLIIHGDPPVHYYIAFIPFILGIVAYFLQRTNYLFTSLILLGIFCINLSFYFGNDDRFDRGLVPYSKQMSIMQDITEKMEGAPYQL